MVRSFYSSLLFFLPGVLLLILCKIVLKSLFGEMLGMLMGLEKFWRRVQGMLRLLLRFSLFYYFCFLGGSNHPSFPLLLIAAVYTSVFSRDGGLGVSRSLQC